MYQNQIRKIDYRYNIIWYQDNHGCYDKLVQSRIVLNFVNDFDIMCMGCVNMYMFIYVY